MPVSTASIISRASKQLYDETNDEWSFIELMRHMNPAIGEIVQFDPKAYMVNAPFQCAAGSLQNLPGDAIALVNVLYNTTENGSPGRGITECDFEMLRRGRPDWARQPPSATARQFAADPNDPKRFYLIPPQPSAPGYIQAVYQMVPPDVTAEQYYTNGSGSGDASGQAVVHLENTIGIAAGQYVDPADVAGAIPPGTKVLTVSAGVSVTLSADLQLIVPPGEILTFSDQYPLPDLYAEAAYLFLLYQAYARRSKDGDVNRSQSYYMQFLKNLDQDVKDIQKIQAGQTRPQPAMTVIANG